MCKHVAKFRKRVTRAWSEHCPRNVPGFGATIKIHGVLRYGFRSSVVLSVWYGEREGYHSGLSKSNPHTYESSRWESVLQLEIELAMHIPGIWFSFRFPEIYRHRDSFDRAGFHGGYELTKLLWLILSTWGVS